MSDGEWLPILCALQDGLMLLAPRGWLVAELEVASTAGGPRLQSISARGGGGAQPRPHPRLNVDPKEEALRFSDALKDLAEVLGAGGKQWSGGKIAVERDEQHARWRLLGADGAEAWTGELGKEQLDALIFTDALFAMLSGSERGFEMLQAQLGASLGEQVGWREVEGGLELETPKGVQRWSAEPIGRYLAEEASFTWAWADEALGARAGRVHAICAPEARQPGLSALWRPHLHCEEGFAWALAGYCAVALGARGIFRAERNGQVLLMALMKRL